ncbi:MAG: hypothetical protein KF740_15440 [Ramlibacter sp.]|nr:hypothetical protein [Ramlibacter sp.]
MESKIPLPTDNIYKFYALFGLLVFIFSIGAMLYSTRSSNELLTNLMVERETLKEVVVPAAGQIARIEVIDRLLEVGKSDKTFLRWALATLFVLGLWSAFYGFKTWHQKIQPIQDELISLQLRKLKVEVANLEREAAAPAQSLLQ